MPTVSTDIDDVCTDDDLVHEAGDVDRLNNIMSLESTRRATRTQVLADVLESLRNRIPPVREGDIRDVTELTRTVTYGTFAAMHRKNITIGNDQDVSANMARVYQKLYQSALDNLRPTVDAGQNAAPFGIATHRR